MNVAIDTVGFIDRDSSKRLAEIEISSLGDLLDRCARPPARRDLAKTTGIPDQALRRWAALAELMRIDGIAPRYAELLVAAGVGSLRELREQDGHRLADAMLAVNEARRYTNLVPSPAIVGGWIEWSRRLEPVLEDDGA